MLGDKQAIGLLKDMRDGYRDKRRDEISTLQRNVAYWSGKQWIQPHVDRTTGNSTTRRLRLDYSPESRHIRVTNNIITHYAQLNEAATRPIGLPLSVEPHHSDIRPESLHLASICANALDATEKPQRRISSTKYSNFAASICGGWAQVLELHRTEVDGIPDWRMRWVNCPPTDLILDVSCDNPDLAEHDEVAIRRILPISKIRSMYGVKVDPEDALTIGELAHDYISAYKISDGSMFKDYARYSKTKGAEVYQLHRKSNPASERFDEMYVFISVGSRSEEQGVDMRLVSGEESPFGGIGLPVMLYNYFWRLGSAIGQSAVSQMVGPQDLINLNFSMFYRGLMHSSTPQWIVDSRSIPKEDMADTFHNRVGGPIRYTGGRPGGETFNPPQSIRTADPNPAHIQLADTLEQSARDRTHRSYMNQGVGKSHVPDMTVQRLLDEGDKVLNLIVEENARVLSWFHEVTLGTIRNAVDVGSPSLMQQFDRAGFTADDLAMFRQLDPVDMRFKVTIEREALRPRSPVSRKADIMNAVLSNNPLISNVQARVALAIEAQQPITESDRFAERYARDVVQRIIAGQPYQAAPGIEHEFMIEMLRRALLQNRNQRPDVAQRLGQAIQQHQQLRADEIAQAMQNQEGQPTDVPGIAQPGGLMASALMPNPAGA